VTADPFKPVREHLAIARTSLELSKPRTDTLLDNIRAVERQMDWRGDPYSAHYTLRGIISELSALPTLLPGVAVAIEQLESAVTLLDAMRSESKDR
jgi:hypothetical protein